VNSFVECCEAAPVGCEMDKSFVEATVRQRGAGAGGETEGTEGATALEGVTPAGGRSNLTLRETEGRTGATASRGATPAGVGTGMETEGTEGATAPKGATPAGVGTGMETEGTEGGEGPRTADRLALPSAVDLTK